MAITTIDKDGTIHIPLDMYRIKPANTVYCFKEHGTHRIYLSKVSLHSYVDSYGMNRSAELICTLSTDGNTFRLPEDVIKELCPKANTSSFKTILHSLFKKSSNKVIVTVGYTHEKEEVVFLKPFED